jgi:hypothetical protein
MNWVQEIMVLASNLHGFLWKSKSRKPWIATHLDIADIDFLFLPINSTIWGFPSSYCGTPILWNSAYNEWCFPGISLEKAKKFCQANPLKAAPQLPNDSPNEGASSDVGRRLQPWKDGDMMIWMVLCGLKVDMFFFSMFFFSGFICFSMFFSPWLFQWFNRDNHGKRNDNSGIKMGY